MSFCSRPKYIRSLWPGTLDQFCLKCVKEIGENWQAHINSEEHILKQLAGKEVNEDEDTEKVPIPTHLVR